MAAPLHERLRFETAEGQVLDGTRRYLWLRADVLRGLFEERPRSGPACHAIAGMLQGLAAIVLGAPASARELACACSTGGDRCRFTAHLDSRTPAATPVPAHPQETNP